MRRLLLVWIAVLPGVARVAPAHAQEPRPDVHLWSSGGLLSPEQAAYDVAFYDLSFRVSPTDSSIAGVAEVHAVATAPLDRFVLDLDTAFTVRSATALNSGRDLTFSHAEGKLDIHLPAPVRAGETVAVGVEYAGRPRVAARPPWVGGFTWAETADGRPWIGVTSVYEGADIWWPVKDHPSDKADSVALHVTVPEGLVVAANGQDRGSRANPDGTRTYHWFVSTPISNYNVSLNIAPYHVLEDVFHSVSGDSVPVRFWVLPEHTAQGQALLPEIKEHLAFFEDLLGPYPFRADKYGVAETPYLGMEHQTIIAYGNEFRKNEHGFDGLHHHELAHEWFANLVTARDWKDFWIHEGFGSYLQPLYIERLHGREALLAEMRASRQHIRNRQPVAPREPKTAAEMFFVPPDYVETDGDVYGKGAYILHTLRYLVGDESFFQALRRMAYPDPALEQVTDGRQVRLVDSEDFVRIASESAGRPLDWFFDVYLRHAALPRLVTQHQGERLSLRWEAPGGLPFEMPIDVQIDGQTRRVAMPGGSAAVLVPTGAEVTIDPEGWVLRAEG